jgi:hypothetical protein
MSLPIGWEDAKLRGLPPERVRGNNGRIMDGRVSGVNGQR